MTEPLPEASVAPCINCINCITSFLPLATETSNNLSAHIPSFKSELAIGNQNSFIGGLCPFNKFQ